MSHRWIKFWPQDWQRDPALRSCSAAARGVWIDMLCIMHEGTPYGHMTIGGKSASARQIGTITGVGEKDALKLLIELEEAGVFSRDNAGTIYSRRMVRDKAASEAGHKFGKTGGNPLLKDHETKTVKGGGNDGGLTPPIKTGLNGGPNLQSTEFKKQETEKKEITPLPPRGKASDDDPAFVAFWAAYPRKDDKGHARKAWLTAVRKADPEMIVAGCHRYRFNENPRFQPLPATWLNGERWLQAAEDDGLDPVLRAAGVTQADIDQQFGTSTNQTLFPTRFIQ
jgi:hypothetical protein